MSEVFERTSITATSRILKHDDNTFTYEVQVLFLPMDDYLRWDSKKYTSAKDCAVDMFKNYNKDVKKLIEIYDP